MPSLPPSASVTAAVEEMQEQLLVREEELIQKEEALIMWEVKAKIFEVALV
jgi:hypothetical protein